MDHPPASKKPLAADPPPPGPPLAPEAAEKKPAATAPAPVKKKPTTLLDAYEVDCIRRELERLVLKHNQNAAGVDATKVDAHGHRQHHHHHHHHHHRSSGQKTTSAKKVSPSPSPAAQGPKKGRGVRLLGRHAVAICSGTVPVAGAARRRPRGAYREVEKV